MSTTIPPSPAPAFRRPLYDCRDEGDAMQLIVYVPGVDAAGVNIEARGPDLRITAQKTHFVRVNWQALHLEGAQRDYRLSLRLGRGFAFEAMDAQIHDGVLTITLPKRLPARAPAAAAAAAAAPLAPRLLRRVA
ncbi:MAG TPA: Hsp20/alpha crystallin family protein [Opitutaceae bacterium]|nr:Hsp20/alpha crystallin family protein [Opitutaceae bacterium]